MLLLCFSRRFVSLQPHHFCRHFYFVRCTTSICYSFHLFNGGTFGVVVGLCVRRFFFFGYFCLIQIVVHFASWPQVFS